MRALWIEDHQLIGDSLEVLLQVLLPDISLDKARDLQTAESLVRTFQYQLVLLDWWIAGVDGEKSIATLRSAGCQTPIVVVSGDEREAVMRRAFALGASAFVPKNTDVHALVDAIRGAIEGRALARPQVPVPVPEFQPEVKPALDVETVFPELTPRQADVFRGLMRGLADKQIGRELGVSETTVKTHVRAILHVVGVRKRGEAVFQAMTRGAGEL